MSKNGYKKIEKWLKNRGYRMTYVSTDMYSYNYPGFHYGEIYFLDVYRTSTGWYIMYKTHGRPRYYLCETTDIHSRVLIAFSQDQFIHFIDKKFPEQ